jgi:hypothetical protein
MDFTAISGVNAISSCKINEYFSLAEVLQLLFILYLSKAFSINEYTFCLSNGRSVMVKPVTGIVSRNTARLRQGHNFHQAL